MVHERQIQPMKRDDERRHGPAHPDGAEPVVFLALVEDDLQAAGPHDQQAEADVVEGADLGVLDVGRIVDEAGDHEDGEDADGNIDVKGVAPAEGVGEPAAQRGAEHRRDDDAEAVSGHGHASVFAGGKLSSRIDCESGCSAPPPAPCMTRASRMTPSEGAAPQKNDAMVKMMTQMMQEALAAEAAGEPVGGRQDDGVGDQVAGQHPGGFGVGGREAAGDVGQRHRRDGGVEHLHEGGQHDRAVTSQGLTPWVSG